MSPVNYRLELPMQWSIHPVFHTDLLTPYRETPTHGVNYQRPPPDLVDGEEEYEIEKILDSRRYGRGRKLQYLVKWKGYPDSDNQWVNKDDVFAEDAIREFENSNSDDAPHIRSARTGETPHPSAEYPHMSNELVSTSSPLPSSEDFGVEAPLTSDELSGVLRTFPTPERGRLSPDSRDTSLPLAPPSPTATGSTLVESSRGGMATGTPSQDTTIRLTSLSADASPYVP
jgi:Chromo (CHRromatin Organisation MOdifier) domain